MAGLRLSSSSRCAGEATPPGAGLLLSRPPRFILFCFCFLVTRGRGGGSRQTGKGILPPAGCLGKRGHASPIFLYGKSYTKARSKSERPSIPLRKKKLDRRCLIESPTRLATAPSAPTPKPTKMWKLPLATASTPRSATGLGLGAPLTFDFCLSTSIPVLTTSKYVVAWPQGDQFLGGDL